MTIGERIRELRTQKGMTQKELGEKCNMADSAIRRYESNRGNPTIETLSRISKALNVRLDDLVGVEVFASGEAFDKEWERRISQIQPGGEQVTVIHKAGGEVQIVDRQKEQLLSTYEMLDSEDRQSLVRHGELLAGQLKYRETDPAGEE